MNPWTEALGPVVICGFALQQLLELLDPLLERLLGGQKAWGHNLLGLIFGLVLCASLGLRALRPFGITQLAWLDLLLTALLISGGTKWVNDLVKVMSYRKSSLRLQAASLEDTGQKA